MIHFVLYMINMFVSKFTPEEIEARNRRVFGDPNKVYTYTPVVARAGRTVHDHDLQGIYGLADS